MDPQHRILLEETWHCIEDSGLPIGLLQSGRTSVNVGLMAQDYLIKGISDNKRVDAFDPIGNYACIASNRISYLLNLTGPSRTVDTACSASLVALAQGRRDLQHEQCDFALVGGVNVVCSPWRYLAFTQSRMLSPDGRCFTFDRRANGYVPGEGAGMVLLTTRERAERLGCHIYGVVKSVATNHNGHNRNLTAPNADAQVDVIRMALDEAGVTPSDVGYVEAHGTGTSLGDPIEIEALAAVYGSDRAHPLQVGSVKTNIGHVEAGAGLAGLIKVLLMLRHGRIVPTLNREVHNPLLRGVGECIAFPDTAGEWATGRGPRTAGVSSFGFGGVNCHAVIQEYQETDRPAASEFDTRAAVFTLSAKTRSALVSTLGAWAADPRGAQESMMKQLCRASNQRRVDLPYRVGARVQDLPQLLAALRRGEEPDAIADVTAQPRPAVLLAPHTGTEPVGPFAASIVRHPELEALTVLAAELGLAGRLASFAAHLDSLDALASGGVRAAELVAVDIAGAAAALVHAEAVSFENAVVALLDGGPFALEEPPRCGVVVCGEQLLPNEFTDDYLQDLLDGCAQALEDVAPYAAQAALLLDHQFTFTRAIGRWEELLGDRGFGLLEVLRDFGGRAPHLAPAQLALTALAVTVALTEIDGAWGLQPARWVDPATRELAGLICENILDREELVAVLYEEIEIAELAAGARTHARVRGGRLDIFTALVEQTRANYNGRLVAAPAADEAMAAAALICEQVDPSAAMVVVGPAPREMSSVFVHIATAGPDDMAAGLLALWLRGHNVSWSGTQVDGAVRPAGLPGYRFDPNPFWHDDIDTNLSGVAPNATAVENRQENHNAARPKSDPTQNTAAAYGLEGGVQFENYPDPGSVEGAGAEMGAPAGRASAVDPAGGLEGLLADLIAEATGSQRALLRPDSEFADIGVDSLIIHQLNTELSARFGDIAATLFFECRTIQEVAERIHRDYASAVAAHFDLVAPGTVASAPSCKPHVSDASGPLAPVLLNAGAPGGGSSRRDPADDGIAIIGFDGRFPGADSFEEFWSNLCDGVDSITEIPLKRWDHAEYFDPRRHVPGKVYSKWGGFLTDVDRFDADALGIPPVEAMFMDPQERLFLEATRGCLESAGYTRDRLRAMHSEVGVYVGSTFNNYQLVQRDAAARSGGYVPINAQTYAIANRVSYVHDLRGPSMTLDTACSSSLYAVHLACESLRRGECAMAIAGGVNLSLHPSKYQMLAQYQFLSSDGRCHAFGEGGDGYVPAEAVGAFLLKPVSDAVRDRDRIYGVIRGSALTHGGRTSGFTVPNPHAHTAAITRAMNQAGCGAETISYFEAHGTGTRLGDPIEVAAIGAAYRGASSRNQYCAIGSVKSNIGHAEAAAGVAQLAKVVMQMYNRVLVPSLHAERTNPAIDFANSPVYVQRELTDWDPVRMGFGDVPRRAGVSSIGAGGTNVHIVLEEYRS
ncbi:phosphopantetheine binding protein [Rhodococcus sp. OK611]|nr:phosphopantetheine binding protein [Rhodococcus sp. OK611]SNX92802.1 Phosphopantetheine attachment site [Rhodococcus sp. OK270]